MMVNTIEDLVEAPGNLVQISQCQLALIKLPVQKYLVDDLLDEPFEPGRRGVFQGSRCGFHTVRQHHEARLLRLRLRSRVPEMLRIDGIFSLELFCLFVEKGNQARAVVLLYDVDDQPSEPVACGNLHAVSHMGNEDET